MRRRMIIVALILGGALALMACEVQFNVGGGTVQPPLPTSAPTAAPPPPTTDESGQLATEAVIGGAVRVYCRTGCQLEEVYPFRDILVYTDYETLLSEMGEMGRVALAWFPEGQPANGQEPVDGTLYIAQPVDNEQAPPSYEFWREFLIAIQSHLPPVTSDETPTANLSVIEGPLQDVTTLITFPSGEDGEEALANLLDVMTAQRPEPEQDAQQSGPTATPEPHPFDVAQAQFLLVRSGADDRLVILLKGTEPPDNPRYCFESNSWLSWLIYCVSFW